MLAVAKDPKAADLLTSWSLSCLRTLRFALLLSEGPFFGARPMVLLFGSLAYDRQVCFGLSWISPQVSDPLRQVEILKQTNPAAALGHFPGAILFINGGEEPKSEGSC